MGDENMGAGVGQGSAEEQELLSPTMIAAIDAAMDAACAFYGFVNDKQLAAFLRISAKTVSWLRHGKVSPTNRALLHIIFCFATRSDHVSTILDCPDRQGSQTES